MIVGIKKRKPDLCNPTLVRFSMPLVYHRAAAKSINEEEL